MRAIIERPEDIGVFVQRIRRDAQLTQLELASALGTSQRWLSELEAGKPKRIDGNYFSVLSKLGITLVAETAETAERDADE